MDTIIRHIISIDKKADDILARTKQRIDEGERSTHADIQNMRRDVINEAKAKAAELHKSALYEAEVEADKIKAASKIESVTMENKFLNIRETLEEEIFSRMIEEYMRDSSE